MSEWAEGVAEELERIARRSNTSLDIGMVTLVTDFIMQWFAANGYIVVKQQNNDSVTEEKRWKP